MCITKDAVVLVIDDCQDNLFLMELVLGSGGYKVATACNGKEGIAKTIELTPNLIVLDMMMPDMSGAEVIEYIQADGKLAKIPIILCTANKRISKEQVRGIVDICYKPFDIEDMMARVGSFIECCQNAHNSNEGMAIADLGKENRQWHSISNNKSLMPELRSDRESLVFSA